MKRLMIVIALLANCMVGGVFASAIGVAPAFGALVLNGIGAVCGNLIPAGALGVGIYTEVWTGEMIKAFRNSVESLGWLNGIRSYDQYAENDVIHFVQIGGDPTVLINNTTYPLQIENLPDADKAISLDKYQTKPTRITDDELYAISYDKMGSVIERHRETGRVGKVVEAAKVDEGDTLRIANANLRYCFGITDPDSLSDIEWAMRWKEIQWIRQEEAKANKI